MKEKVLKQSSSHGCIRKLTHGRCKGEFHEDCIRPVGWDHGTLWNDNGKPRFLVYEPYNMDFKQLAQLVKQCEEHDLDIHIDGWSLWNPGHTFRIILYRKGDSLSNIHLNLLGMTR